MKPLPLHLCLSSIFGRLGAMHCKRYSPWAQTPGLGDGMLAVTSARICGSGTEEGYGCDLREPEQRCYFSLACGRPHTRWETPLCQLPKLTQSREYNSSR